MRKLKHKVAGLLRDIFPTAMEYVTLRRSHDRMQKAAKRLASFTDEDWIDYDKKLYRDATGHELDLEDPQRFTEKIQWRKLYDIDPLYAKLPGTRYIARDVVVTENERVTFIEGNGYGDVALQQQPLLKGLKPLYDSLL